ncbi:bifunctional UDP-N-acetylglucosamine diphosphorylase/glucosamine-1-phosphate N-acetyltransferase GlmU [Egicoccus sp. AB-alg2]|uniref:bifunctional UDP-N-acetylglucosamine diphosphorylase/glucosamine-1-phosphate N-acetyltransferase GlmU n=1 Tax=Egicoccus sp. AB-alg2 TaxID=3242693 RepID=UPI00359EFAFE
MSDNARTAAVVLAAGKGTRFRSDLAKVLHRAAGRTLVGHVLEALRPLGLGQVVVVVGHQAEDVTASVQASDLPGLTTVVQEEQHGTGHAVQVAMPALADDVDRVLVLPGDTPLLTAPTLERLLAAAQGSTAAMLTARLEDPTGYGRVLRDADGNVTGIVEQRDATDAQRAIDEINAGMYVVARDHLVAALGQLDTDNDQGELYLTDVVGILAGKGEPVAAFVTSEDEVAGVNDRRQLADAAAVLRRRHLDHLMTEVGVSVADPATTHLDVDVEVGRDAVLLPGTILESGTRIGERAVVGPNSHLTACQVGNDATVHSTRATEAVIGEHASVGPFTHLRPGTRLGVKSKAGAFVETKNAQIGDGSKVPHLAYLGDATVGEQVNIACGVITVNYDGFTKSHTTIEDGAFVGCDTMLVAPVTVGSGAFVAAGSTLTDDVPADALAIARARQVNKEGWAAERRRQHGR